jgi:outer membrane protein assembly factor BamB
MKRFLIFLSLILLLSSCLGPFKELKYQIEDGWDEQLLNGQPTPLIDIANEKDVKSLWTIQNSSEKFWGSNDKLLESHRVDSFIFEDFLFTVNNKGGIKKINLSDGKVLWEKSFDVDVSAGLSGDSDYLYFVTGSGLLWCIDHRGNELWKSYVGGQVFIKPLPNSTFVVVKLNNNKFVQLNSIDGTIKWQYEPPNPPLSMNTQGDIIYSDGVIYSGLPQGKLIAIAAETGLFLWEVTFSSSGGLNEIERIDDVTSKPVIDGSIIYVISSSGNIAAIDRRSALVNWSRPLSSSHGFNLSENSLVIVHETNSIYSLNNEAGKTNWKNEDLKYRNIGRGAIVGNYLVVGDFEGFLHFFNLNDGKLSNRIKMSGSQIIDNIIVVNENKLIATDVTGNIFLVSIN